MDGYSPGGHRAARSALETLSEQCCQQTDRQLAWLKTQIQTAAPQALTVPADPQAHLAASLPTPTPKPPS